jgi:hypothetical protein
MPTALNTPPSVAIRTTKIALFRVFCSERSI